MPEIQQADPEARRRTIALLSIALVVCALVVLIFESNREQFMRWLETHIDLLITHPEVILLVGYIFMAPIIGVAIYLWRFSMMIISDRRFPPANGVVVRDTIILEGLPAVYRGRVLQILSALLFICSTVFPIIIWYLFWTLDFT